MYSKEDILGYKCPRMKDWPGLELYMDQVISLLDQSVLLFYPDDQPKPVTSTMINNYVKQKIVIPSHKKKYTKEHLAYLYIIFLLKPVLSLTDICATLNHLKKQPSIEDAYDGFCAEIEAAMAKAFAGEAITAENPGAIRAVALAFAYTLLARAEL